MANQEERVVDQAGRTTTNTPATEVDPAPGAREALVSRAFVGLADTLVDDYDIIDLLDRLAGYSVELLAADAAGIMLGDARQQLRVVASTNEQSDWMELLQLEADQGPCLDCYRSGAAVSVADLTDAAARWPRFVAALAQRGTYGSVHALPLRDEPLGTLNLFHRLPGLLPRRRPCPGRRRDDRDPVRTRHPPRRGDQRTASGRAEQPGHRRTGKRRARRNAGTQARRTAHNDPAESRSSLGRG